MKKAVCSLLIMFAASVASVSYAQVNTDQVIRVGRNALYFEDYMLSIQYFNRAIAAKPYLAQPYLYRAIAKLNLDDYRGAEADAARAIEINPYLTDAWEVRGVARQNLGLDSAAIADYDKALELLPRNRQLLFNKALAQHSTGRFADADSTFATLLRYYPAFDNAYLGRARLRLERSDTVGAVADIDKALSINKNAVNAYIMRADIAINGERDYRRALADMDEAIRLQPRMPGLYVNRAFLRYSCDDYFGAMADYEYALTLDPLNVTALFNRGILEAEVSANDKALDDFNRVLQLEPDDIRSLYNRALILHSKGDLNGALADVNRVIEAFPDFPGTYYVRSQIYRDKGDMRRAEADYNRARAMSKALPRDGEESVAVAESPVSDADDVPEELVSRRFATLLTVDDNADIHEEYNNTAIKGRVQDRDMSIELEAPMQLSYYSAPTELQPGTYYIKEVDQVNATRALRFVLMVTNRVPAVDADVFNRHFASIEYYNSYLATHTPRAVDYLGLAMDHITVRDYAAAEQDVSRALALMPDSPLAYLMRAQARLQRLNTEHHDATDDETAATDAATRAALHRQAIDAVLSDLDECIKLAPDMAMAWYNKGCVHAMNDDYTSALAAFNRAIELKPDLGEAYYNRGYIRLKLGNQRAGIADLGKAGELGILPAYNLIKRISR